MRRGTTPQHIFNLDIDLTDAEVIYITYKQGGNVILEKTIEDILVEANKLTVTLTQAETLSFATADRVKIQIRAKYADGSAIASNIIDTSVEAILKEGEI